MIRHLGSRFTYNTYLLMKQGRDIPSSLACIGIRLRRHTNQDAALNVLEAADDQPTPRRRQGGGDCIGFRSARNGPGLPGDLGSLVDPCPCGRDVERGLHASLPQEAQCHAGRYALGLADLGDGHVSRLERVDAIPRDDRDASAVDRADFLGDDEMTLRDQGDDDLLPQPGGDGLDFLLRQARLRWLDPHKAPDLVRVHEEVGFTASSPSSRPAPTSPWRPARAS